MSRSRACRTNARQGTRVVDGSCNSYRRQPCRLRIATRQPRPRPMHDPIPSIGRSPLEHATARSPARNRQIMPRRPAGRRGARHPAAYAGRLRRMVAARLAGRWHAAVPCLLAAQATTRRRRWPPSGRDKLATDGRAAAREKFFLETLVSLSLSLSLSLGAIWRCFAAKEDSRGRTGSACLLRRAGVRVTPPRTQAMGPASTQRAHRRQARRILCERRRLGPYCGAAARCQQQWQR
jgi:hypothetical protein